MPKPKKLSVIAPEDGKKLHVKPTAEELEANAQKALEEADALKNKDKDPIEPEDPEPTDPVKPVEPSKEPVKPAEPKKPEPKPGEPDYKEKFIQSTKENQVISAKNKAVNEKIKEARSLPEPTEEELTKEYPDWELMSDTEKKLAKETFLSTRRFKILEGIAIENEDYQEWQGKVDEYVDDPQTLINHPELEGKVDEFKLFATKPTRQNVDFEDLLKAFLFDATKAVKPKKKTSMFETGTGGPTTKGKPASNKISIEQSRILRKTNYKKFKEMSDAGLIEEFEL